MMNTPQCKDRVKSLLDALDKLPDDVLINTASVSGYGTTILLCDELHTLADLLHLEVKTRNYGPWIQQSAVLDNISLDYFHEEVE